MSFFGFRPQAGITINLDGEEEKKKITVKPDGRSEVSLPIYLGSDSVKGSVEVKIAKKVEHIGIKIELKGEIELFYDRSNNSEFLSFVKELAPPGQLLTTATYPFEFNKCDMRHESYAGMNVRVRYYLVATMTRQYASNVVAERELWVQNLQEDPEINQTIKMEVGIEECLHIEFEYDKAKYHLSDIVLGKIYFLLVRIKIKHMELAVIRREAAGSGSNVYNESETVTKFEVMDGAPVRGECVPIRLFLSNLDLTPTYKNVNNKFTTRYYLNLVLIDEEDRRYFKQQEVVLWRKDIG